MAKIVEVELIRHGGKPEHTKPRWNWKTKQHGEGILFNTKYEARDDWEKYARQNNVTDYKFIQRA